MPVSMDAVEIAAAGGPEVLQPCRRPLPRPGPGEVLVRVAAAGVNRPDLMQRQGLYPPPPGASDLPGLEIAGEVVAVGEGVARPAPGDLVCALATGGGYARYCTAAAPLCLPIPRGLNELQAAAIPETFFTVWANVFQRGGLKGGESLLVHGGSGGIGSTAIQLAREFGARVHATAGGPESCRFCEDLGAAAIDYKREDFAERIREETGGRGVDLILDIVGGPYLSRNLNCLARGGRLLVVAVQGGPKSEMSLLPILLKHLTVTGSTLRPRSVEEKAGIAAELKDRVWPLLEAGRVAPVIYRTFPLAEAAAAHRLLEAGGHRGKIVLTLD
jgi:putative PIG3 family NAD(P)H quinone oxidoreductase